MSSNHPTRVHRLLACISIIVLSLVVSARAQTPPPLDDATAGTRFIVAFPDTTSNTADPRFPNSRVQSEISIWMYSPVANVVRIRPTSWSTNTVITLQAGEFKAYRLMLQTAVTTINTPALAAYLVEAESPIVMYCYLAQAQGVEAWSAMPVENWGTEYRAAAIPGELLKSETSAGETKINTITKDAPAEILVTAAYDATRVSVVPPAGMHFAGNPPATFTLNEGECVLLQSIADTAAGHDRQREIAGASIFADKPVGVISGNTRAQAYHAPNDTLKGILGNAYKNMMIETLTPMEQCGRQHMFLPTWDIHRSGVGSASQRDTEFARVYNVSGRILHGSYLRSTDSVRSIPFTIPKDSLLEIAFSTPASQPAATVINTDARAQVMMHSSAIVRFNGRGPCFSSTDCISYSAWAPYMVSMTPREQWTTFAPYYAPTNPGTMLHYISVITDEASAPNIYLKDGSKFVFNRTIPGTDLVWGTRSVTPGTTNWIEGRNGARFGGVVFGTMEGGEEYRSGSVQRRKDGATIAASTGARPLEFEEYNAVSYGYPLAPRRTTLLTPDSLIIRTTSDCWLLTIMVSAVNENPSGLRSVTLVPQSTTNTALVPVNPQRLSDIIGRSQCTVHVEAIDPLRPAHAEIAITDRTGAVRLVPFDYIPEIASIDQPLHGPFEITEGTFVADTVVVRNITYPRTVTIKTIELLNDSASGITLAAPATPYTLAIGDSLPLFLRYGPAVAGRTVRDTLRVTPACGPILNIPIRISGKTVGSGVERGGDEHAGIAIVAAPQGTALHFHLGESGRVLVEIFDAAGRRMGTPVDGLMNEGDHVVPLDDRTFPAGAYYCRVSMQRSTVTGSWVVVR